MIIPLKDKTLSLTCPDDIHKVLQTVLAAEDPASRDQEHFWVFHLTKRNTVKSLHLVSLGTLDTALVHPREVFTRAVSERCASIVLAHNHPSGNPEPSNEDLRLTAKLKQAGEILGIEVMDHVITTDSDFYSFRAHGELT